MSPSPSARPSSGPSPADALPSGPTADRAKLERKILSQAHLLLTRQIPDLAYAKQQFPIYDRASFQRSFDGSTPAERDLANRAVAAFDDAMNAFNEVLRNVYGLIHGYRRMGPAMPVVYEGLKLTHAAELLWINDTRNDLTHDYPVAEATRIFDAIAELHRVSVRTLRDVRDFAAEQGLVIPGIA
jgi:hypothetical protein